MPAVSGLRPWSPFVVFAPSAVEEDRPPLASPFPSVRRSGFEETAADVVDQSSGFKLVPWLSWDEWDSVRESLFSSSSCSISFALQRIMSWRSRGCLPVVIEVTASIIEIQQRDPFFRADLDKYCLEFEEIMAMLYCMAIMRLVNGVVEKTRKKKEISIAKAAEAINIPRMLIDIRHEGSHRDLPSLQLVRIASVKALEWLKSYYWEPQKKAISCKSDETASLRKEIKSRLCELAFRLKFKHAGRSGSLLVKGKRIKHVEPLCRLNKFLSLTSKPLSSKSTVSKKEISKALKHVVRLYSSYSSEVVSVITELLLKDSDSSDFSELLENQPVSHGTTQVQDVFDNWKHVVAKLSNKEPKLLLTLMKACLEMIETQEASKDENGEHATSENTAVQRLSNLFEGLVRNLKALMPASRDAAAEITKFSASRTSFPKAALVEILRKALLLSCPCNNQLMGSALVLANAIGNNSLVERLNKLRSLRVSGLTIDEQNPSTNCSQSIFAQQADSLGKAAQKLEFVKLNKMKSNALRRRGIEEVKGKRWIVAESWNSCPIGMLPCDVGFSCRLPVLDCDGDSKKLLEPLERKEERAFNGGTFKRGRDCNTELEKKSPLKKLREAGGAYESTDTLSEGGEGQLMINGVWKKVGEEELLSIASAVRILV